MAKKVKFELEVKSTRIIAKTVQLFCTELNETFDIPFSHLQEVFHGSVKYIHNIGDMFTGQKFQVEEDTLGALRQ